MCLCRLIWPCSTETVWYRCHHCLLSCFVLCTCSARCWVSCDSLERHVLKSCMLSLGFGYIAGICTSGRAGDTAMQQDLIKWHWHLGGSWLLDLECCIPTTRNCILKYACYLLSLLSLRYSRNIATSMLSALLPCNRLYWTLEGHTSNTNALVFKRLR